MHGVRRVWRRWLHTVTTAGVAVWLFVLLLSVAGFVVTTRLVDADRSAAAHRSAETDAAQVLALLQQTETFSTGLATVLEGEPVRNAAASQHWRVVLPPRSDSRRRCGWSR